MTIVQFSKKKTSWLNMHQFASLFGKLERRGFLEVADAIGMAVYNSYGFTEEKRAAILKAHLNGYHEISSGAIKILRVTDPQGILPNVRIKVEHA